MNMPSSSLADDDRFTSATARGDGAAFIEVDGTLIDSSHERAQAWAETLAELGHQVRFERLWRLASAGADILSEVTGLSEPDAHAEHIRARYRNIFRQKYLPRVRPLPGARALLERLRVDGLRIIALSCDAETDALLGATGLRELLECSGDEAASADEAVHGALLRADCPPHKALVIASSPHMVKAAAHAGLRSVAVLSGGYAREALSGALTICSNPQELLEALHEVLPRPNRC